ncbi:MAG: dephospho-CoA kinase [Sulfurovum sp.]
MLFEYAIALTGGIASGKSSVVDIMLSLGFEVIDADKVAHEVLDREKQKVVKLFGETILVEDKINRKALGSIVFGDKSKLKQLEALLHPLIYEEIEAQAREKDIKEKPYFIDIPLFFESDRYQNISKSLLVYTPKEKQLERLIKRDNSTKEEALLRINSQMDIEEKKSLATYIIDNSGSQERLRQLCVNIINKLGV